MIAGTMLSSIELRRYRMKKGRRDDLIALFEERFIEGQEACGMVPVGHFRDPNDDDAFIWFRGFPQFEDRAKALEAFYMHSDTWRTHRDAANDTLIDSDDVLLLRPAREQSGFDVDGMTRPARSSAEETQRVLWLCVVMLAMPASEATVTAFEREALARLGDVTGGVSYFVTEQRRNEFARLPVREGEYAFVACAMCRTSGDVRHCEQIVDERFVPALAGRVVSVEHVHLRPARRSLLR
ncbi:MAG: NIPSNAP family protein [Candidatus Eremiobacteraeota bacterium]|nr:NIPSNAP family protein [Candidatus Eremiobacteraeota bacterium]